MASIVTRDGKAVSPVLDDADAASVWLLKHQPMSTDWAFQHEGYAIVDVTEYRWQLCQDGNDITTDFYADADADLARAWRDDFCLVEVTKVGDHWEITGGDGDWTPLAETWFGGYGPALAAYGALHVLVLHEQS